MALSPPAGRIGVDIEVVPAKDMDCLMVYDDTAVAVRRNTGEILGGPGHDQECTSCLSEEVKLSMTGDEARYRRG